MDDELRHRLGALPVRAVVEYLADRLGLADDEHDGHWKMAFEIEGGNLRRAEVTHGQIGNVELDKLSPARNPA